MNPIKTRDSDILRHRNSAQLQRRDRANGLNVISGKNGGELCARVNEFQCGGKAGVFGEVTRLDETGLHRNSVSFQCLSIPGGAVISDVDPDRTSDVRDVTVATLNKVFDYLTGPLLVFTLDNRRSEARRVGYGGS